MKKEKMIKSGAAIGGALALLVLSGLFAASPALARGGGSTKLLSTGVEPGASGQARMTDVSVEHYYPYPGSGFWITGTMTVTCRGLTPGQTYSISTVDPYSSGEGSAGGGGAVAQARGELKTAFAVFLYNSNQVYICVVNQAGQIVLEGWLLVP